MHNEIDQDQ